MFSPKNIIFLLLLTGLQLRKPFIVEKSEYWFRWCWFT